MSSYMFSVFLGIPSGISKLAMFYKLLQPSRWSGTIPTLRQALTVRPTSDSWLVRRAFFGLVMLTIWPWRQKPEDGKTLGKGEGCVGQHVITPSNPLKIGLEMPWQAWNHLERIDSKCLAVSYVASGDHFSLTVGRSLVRCRLSQQAKCSENLMRPKGVHLITSETTWSLFSFWANPNKYT